MQGQAVEVVDALAGGGRQVSRQAPDADPGVGEFALLQLLHQLQQHVGVAVLQHRLVHQQHDQGPAGQVPVARDVAQLALQLVLEHAVVEAEVEVALIQELGQEQHALAGQFVDP